MMLNPNAKEYVPPVAICSGGGLACVPGYDGDKFDRYAISDEDLWSQYPIAEEDMRELDAVDEINRQLAAFEELENYQELADLLSTRLAKLRHARRGARGRKGDQPPTPPPPTQQQQQRGGGGSSVFDLTAAVHCGPRARTSDAARRGGAGPALTRCGVVKQPSSRR